MTHTEAINFLFSLKRLGIRPDLETIGSLLDRLGNPHRNFKSVLIAGTNGKGSTASILHSIMVESGCKTGLYTSPHLIDIKERILVAREKIPEVAMVEAVEEIQSVSMDNPPTFFECLTAIAFLYFSKVEVELAVVEVGMGGRWDATNILDPELSIISSIGLDHTEHLGNTLKEIAEEKGEIIKKNGTLVACCQEEKSLEVFQKICSERQAKMLNISREFDAEVISMNFLGSIFNLSFKNNQIEAVKVPLAGSHQVKNAQTAMAAAWELKNKFSGISHESLLKGAKKTSLRGRLDTVSVSPKVVLDVAHNPQAARTLVNELQELFEFSRLVFIVGIRKDKDIPLIIKELAKISDMAISVKPGSEGMEDPGKITGYFQESGVNAESIDSLKTAILKGKELAGKDGLVCVTGSFITVGEAYKIFGIRV